MCKREHVGDMALVQYVRREEHKNEGHCASKCPPGCSQCTFFSLATIIYIYIVVPPTKKCVEKQGVLNSCIEAETSGALIIRLRKHLCKDKICHRHPRWGYNKSGRSSFVIETFLAEYERVLENGVFASESE